MASADQLAPTTRGEIFPKLGRENYSKKTKKKSQGVKKKYRLNAARRNRGMEALLVLSPSPLAHCIVHQPQQILAASAATCTCRAPLTGAPSDACMGWTSDFLN